jgi:hypothetical protein
MATPVGLEPTTCRLEEVGSLNGINRHSDKVPFRARIESAREFRVVGMALRKRLAYAHGSSLMAVRMTGQRVELASVFDFQRCRPPGTRSKQDAR